MKHTSRCYRIFAKTAMEGKFGILVAAMVLVEVADLLAGQVTGIFFPGGSVPGLILGQIFAFGIGLLMNIFTVGLDRMYLMTARYQKCSLEELLYFFKNNPDRVLVASFVLCLLQEVATIPLYIVVYGMDAGNTMESYTRWAVLMLGAMLLALVLELLLTVPFAMTYFVLTDAPELSGIGALKESMRMMKGNKGKYLKLVFSFVPFFLLAPFTLYLLLLWVIPYINVAEAVFYRDLLGEYALEGIPEGTTGKSSGEWEA